MRSWVLSSIFLSANACGSFSITVRRFGCLFNAISERHLEKKPKGRPDTPSSLWLPARGLLTFPSLGVCIHAHNSLAWLSHRTGVSISQPVLAFCVVHAPSRARATRSVVPMALGIPVLEPPIPLWGAKAASSCSWAGVLLILLKLTQAEMNSLGI